MSPHEGALELGREESKLAEKGATGEMGCGVSGGGSILLVGTVWEVRKRVGVVEG